MRKFDGFFSCLYVPVICWVWNKAAVLTPRRCWLTWKRALWTKSWRAHCVMCLITNSSSVMCRDQAIIGMYVSGLLLRTFLECLLVRFRTVAVDVHNSCVIYNSVWAQNTYDIVHSNYANQLRNHCTINTAWGCPMQYSASRWFNSRLTSRPTDIIRTKLSNRVIRERVLHVRRRCTLVY